MSKVNWGSLATGSPRQIEGWMTGMIAHPAIPPPVRSPQGRYLAAFQLFRYTFGQAPARALQGLDALYLFGLYHPHPVKLPAFDDSLAEQIPYIGLSVAQLSRCRLDRQRFAHLSPLSFDVTANYTTAWNPCQVQDGPRLWYN